MAYRIGDEQFRTKAEINARASSLLNACPVGKPVIGQDAAFLRALFAHHPEACAKSGGYEVSHFEVGFRRGEKWGHKVFMVVFTDGGRDDFSITKALLATKPI